MELKFRWNGEEGNISKADRERVINADWIIAADFLQDVIYEAQRLYEELSEKRRREEENMTDKPISLTFTWCDDCGGAHPAPEDIDDLLNSHDLETVHELLEDIVGGSMALLDICDRLMGGPLTGETVQ